VKRKEKYQFLWWCKSPHVTVALFFIYFSFQTQTLGTLKK